jgi:hypothetical protein
MNSHSYFPYVLIWLSEIRYGGLHVMSLKSKKNGLLDCEDGTDTLSRNVGKGLPFYAA